MKGAERFWLLDACAGEKFAGVPLAAVGGADELTPAQRLLIAREFNFALTAFLLEPRNPTNSARAQIFSPLGECRPRLEAVLALSALLAKERAESLLRRGGLTVAIEQDGACWRCDVIANSAGVCYSETALGLKPRRAEPRPSATELAPALGLACDEIGFGAHQPSRFEAYGAVNLLPLGTRGALLAAKAVESEPAPPTGPLLLYTNDVSAPETAIEARMLDASLGVEALVALTGALIEFERPPDGAHQIFIDVLDMHERRARVTLRFDIAGGALERLSLGAQTAFVATGEFCR